MHNKLFFRIACTFLPILFFGCNEPEGFQNPEDPLDAGREFVRAILDGNYQKAGLYIIGDQEDKDLFTTYQQYMKKQPQKERLLLKSSSIIIHKSETINDSVTIINFSNSHSMKPMDIKVIREDNTWKIDFSYTFSGNLPIE